MQGYYRVPLTIREDIQALKRHVHEFKQGQLSAAKFRGFRVPLGIYEQRQPDTFMMRVRIPGGGITPVQLRELARIATDFGGKPHITTRQDVQLQNIRVDDLVPIYQELYRIGLTCKGGGGNTVRNITACVDAGICTDETFNVLPHAIALTEYLIQFPSSYNLPRKFKIAFSGCARDCSLATVNDLGFIAKSRDGRAGFSVYAGGGMGAKSRVAEQISDFVDAEDIGYVAEAVKRLFDAYGDRKHKHRARLRFVLDTFGFRKFKELYEEELKAVREEGPIYLDVEEREAQPPAQSDLGGKATPMPPFASWKKANAREQKQTGFYSVRIPIPLGDVEAGTLKQIADLVEKVGEKSLRTSQAQDFLIRWVKEDDLPLLHRELDALGLADPKRLNINHLVCCTGAATCKLGMCLSQGLSQALGETLDEAEIRLADFPEVNVRINGCPNACGHHPIGTIGLHGGSRRVDGRIAPHYNVLLGGLVEEGKTRLGTPFGYVAAKNVPALIRDFLSSYVRVRDRHADFHEFARETGEVVLRELVEKYSRTPTYEKAPEYYTDWSSREEFSLAGLSPGECGAGVLDMIVSDLEEASSSHEAFKQSGNVLDLYKAVVSASKSLLVTKGLDPKDDVEALDLFARSFIEGGWVGKKYGALIQAALAFKRGDRSDLGSGEVDITGLIERLKVLYESMDSNLQFRVERAETQGAQPSQTEGTVKSMDLRGVPCPVNYVKAKIVLEDLEIGDFLELLLDDGEPINNVPSSLENDGQEILDVRKENSHYFLKIRKRV